MGQYKVDSRPGNKGMEEEKIVETLPDKSRSLRRSSVKKRLDIEIQKTNGKVKEKVSKKRVLSKYRRKVANAKERERMKKMNDVFDVLKKVIPIESTSEIEDEKETKVSTLRSAISYINCLKKLIDDCDAGLLDRTVFQQVEKEKENIENKSEVDEAKKKKIYNKKTSKQVKPRVKARKKVSPDSKWIHYSADLLGLRYATPKDINKIESECLEQEKSDTKQIKDCEEHERENSVTPTTFELKDSELDNSGAMYEYYYYVDSSQVLSNPSQDIGSGRLFLQLPPSDTSYSSSSSTTSSCSSPRDVNEISLHISLLDSSL